MNSAILTTSIHPKPSFDVFRTEPVTIISAHYRQPKQYLAVNKSSNSSKSDNSTTGSTENDTVVSIIKESLQCVYWDEG